MLKRFSRKVKKEKIIDIVSEPSTQGAFMKLTESKQKQIWSKADRINRLLNDIVGEK